MKRPGKFIYGEISERYVAQLFSGVRVRQGDVDVRVNLGESALELECKASKTASQVLNRYQQCYLPQKLAMQASREEKIDSWSDALLKGENQIFYNPYYYALIERNDEAMHKELHSPVSSMRLSFGDIHIIPAELAQAYFLMQYRRHQNNRERSLSFEEAKKDLIQYVRIWTQLDRKPTHKTEDGDWQSIYPKDIEIIGSENFAPTKKIRDRVDEVRNIYPSAAELVATETIGPSEARIRILSKPTDSPALDEQICYLIQQNSALVEDIQSQRRNAAKLLEEADKEYVESAMKIKTYKEAEKEQAPFTVLEKMSEELIDARKEKRELVKLHEEVARKYPHLLRFEAKAKRVFSLVA